MKKLYKALFSNEKLTTKSCVIRSIVCIVLSILVAFLGEMFFNRHVLFNGSINKGITEVGVVQNENGIYEIGFERQFVDKISYSYEAAGAVVSEIRVNVAGAGEPENLVSIIDNNNQYIRESVVKVGLVTDKIYIEIKSGENVIINSASVNNVFQFNYRRMIAVFSAVLLVVFIILFSNILTERLEVAFVVLALGMGITHINIMPTQKNAWDEGVHFRTAYRTTFGSEVGVSDVISVYFDDARVWPLNQPQTYEEYQILEEYLDQHAVYDSEDANVNMIPCNDFKMANIGYVPSGMGLTIGRWLNLPFSELFKLGKYFNLFIYILVVYFAIKKCVMGKRIMTAVALMPTLITTATVYSRDAVLNAFALLGMAYLISMFVEKDKTISWKDYLIFVVSLYIVSSIKAIYAPFLLLILLVPTSRFKDKKTMYIMKAGVFVVGFLLMASFILPATSPDNNIGDSRGGNTSGPGQMSFIMSNPLVYTKILLTAIRMNFIDYTMGAEALAEVGHWGVIPYTNTILIIMLILALSDKNEKTDMNLGIIAKLGIAAMSFVIICFIWTSMYLSFTEVGSLTIAGVQGRYFIPLIYPLMLILNTSKVKVDISPRLYNTVLMLVMVGVQYLSLYDMVIRNYCV